MTKQELTDAKKIAMNGGDLGNVDDSILHGLCTRGFNYPVYTSLNVVARLMRDFIQFNGQWDEESIAEICKVAKTRIKIV